MSNELHENYLQVFNNYHNTWLRKYYEKNKLFYKQICHHKDGTETYEISTDEDSDSSEDDESMPDLLEESLSRLHMDHHHFNASGGVGESANSSFFNFAQYLKFLTFGLGCDKLSPNWAYMVLHNTLWPK